VPSVDLQIPARAPFVGVVRLALASLARGAGLDEEKVDDLKIAVSEACATAVLLAEGSDPAPPIDVRWNDDGDRLTVEITDSAPRSDETADAGDSLSLSSRAVMSEALLRTLVHDYESTQTPEGTVTRLRIDR